MEQVKERGSEVAKASVLGRAGEKDNFLALLLNKSVSIATIQPAAGEREGERERGESGGAPERQRERKRERVTIATEEEGEKGLGETLKETYRKKM